MARGAENPSAWQLRTDLAWARGLLWVASTGRGGEPKRDVHLYLADRYGRLADHYAKRGAARKAKRLSLKAEWHYRAAGLDDPPRAVAMAMPIPEGPTFTNAVARDSLDSPDDVA